MRIDTDNQQFPGVCLTLGPDRWSELHGLYVRLQERAGEKVMRTLASSLHELAKILHPDQVERDLLPVYERCLRRDDDIRERIFEHIDDILSNVSADVGWKLFLELASAWKEGTLGGWRAREKLASHIPSFLSTFRDQEDLNHVLDMIRDSLLDPFSAVRQAAVQGVSRLKS